MEDSGAEDGVYLFRPHTSYISGLRCVCCSNVLWRAIFWMSMPTWSPHMFDHASWHIVALVTHMQATLKMH